MELSKEVDIFLFLFIGTLGMFLLSGGIVAVFILYQKKLFKQQLVLAEMETTYKEELVHSNIHQVEEERKRVSRDLHDEIGGLFSTLSIKINQMQVTPTTSNAVKLIDDCKGLIDAGIKSVRRISHDMVPPALELFGLTATLEVFCAQQASDVLEVDFCCETLVKEPDAQQSLALYRIIQELFTNTLRYAGASRISLKLKGSFNKLTLVYSDDGKGFDLAVAKNKKGIGLRNINSRVIMINAAIKYETAIGKGLTVVIELPYKTNLNSKYQPVNTDDFPVLKKQPLYGTN